MTQANPPSQHVGDMLGNRPKLYLAALIGLGIFGGIVAIDIVRPGILTAEVALGASLGLALSGLAVIATRPRGKKRVAPHEAQPKDFTSVLEERRKLTEHSADKSKQLPPE
ncbi:hypothetical protein ACFOMD_12215 [Sphingoaurantiacus capsulatus]|uniref:Uncharacterized protein n=1 Tax=Sphingoaurantiacus capsulatus TaxID=1771310 RepID=A0ABV7XDL0_9SPHN